MPFVEINRARDRAELVTDDRVALKEQPEALTGERIAALETVGEDRAIAPEGGTAAGPDLEVARESESGMGTATERGGLATPSWDLNGDGIVDNDFGTVGSRRWVWRRYGVMSVASETRFRHVVRITQIA